MDSLQVLSSCRKRHFLGHCGICEDWVHASPMHCNASQPSMKPVAVTISHPLTLLEQAVKEVGRVDDVEGNAPDLQVAGALEPEKSVLRRANPLMPSTPKLKFSSCCSLNFLDQQESLFRHRGVAAPLTVSQALTTDVLQEVQLKGFLGSPSVAGSLSVVQPRLASRSSSTRVSSKQNPLATVRW